MLVSSDKIRMKSHQVVLAANSNFFKDVFQNHSEEVIIVLVPYSSTVISSFLNFCYTGEISIENEFVNDFVEICKQFSVEHPIKLLENDNPVIKPEDEFGKSIIQESETIFFDENDFEGDENMKEEFLDSEKHEEFLEDEFDPKKIIKYENQSAYIVDEVSEENREFERKLEKSGGFPLIKKTIAKKAPTSSKFSLINLKEEQEKFKKRLQLAINSCKDGSNSIKKASKIFSVTPQAIQRNLQGFKNTF